jgi:multiple sugar transport system substrate-binding protein
VDPATCRVADRVGLALLPGGFAGRRAAYAGCHSFALSARARNVEGALALLRFLTSEESQLAEAGRGAVPVRKSALEAIRSSASEPAEVRRWDLLARTSEEALIIPPRFASYPACEDAIWQSLQEAIEGRLSPRAAVAAAREAIENVVRGGP